MILFVINIRSISYRNNIYFFMLLINNRYCSREGGISFLKKVCHVTSAHKRYDTRIFYKECTSLVNAGYEVYLVINDDLENEEKNGVKIVSTGFVARNRGERFTKGRKKLLEKILEINADIYHLHDPDLLLIALKLKKRGKCVIFDSHEIVRNDIKDKEYIPIFFRAGIAKMYAIFEDYILKRIDSVIGVTPLAIRVLGKSGNNVTMITNFPKTIVEGKNSPEVECWREKQLCFAGGINNFWSHEKIIDVLDKVDVKYCICGTAEKEYIEKIQKHKNWKYVNYIGSINHEDVLPFLENSMAGIALLRPICGIGKEGTLGNTKIFEYMRAGIPIIATDFSIWREIIVEKSQCGFCINLEKKDELIEAIQYIASHPIEAKKMGENGKKAFLTEYNWETQVPILVGLYRKLESQY